MYNRAAEDPDFLHRTSHNTKSNHPPKDNFHGALTAVTFVMDHPDTLPAEQALSAKRPRRGIFQINHADPQSFELPLDYYHKLCIVVGWSNGWSECSTKKRKDHVLVAKVCFLFPPRPLTPNDYLTLSLM